MLDGAPQVADMGGLHRAGVELGLDDEFAACDGMRVVGDAVDAAVAAGLVELGVEAHLGE